MRKKLNGRVLAGLVILSVVLLVALLAPVLAPHEFPTSWAYPTCAPPRSTPWGPTTLGRISSASLIYGTRISLLIGVVSALAVTVVGTALGTPLRLFRRMDGPDHHARLTNVAMGAAPLCL